MAAKKKSVPAKKPITRSSQSAKKDDTGFGVYDSLRLPKKSGKSAYGMGAKKK